MILLPTTHKDGNFVTNGQQIYGSAKSINIWPLGVAFVDSITNVRKKVRFVLSYKKEFSTARCR
jgi:hypothetical protein